MVIINNSEGQLHGCPTIEICFEKYFSKSFKKLLQLFQMYSIINIVRRADTENKLETIGGIKNDYIRIRKINKHL